MTEPPRIAARVIPRQGEPIEVQVMSQGFLDIFEARDISITGIGIFVPYRFEGCRLTSPVALVVTLPSEAPFLAKGRVVHRTMAAKEFFGVEFVDLPEAWLLAISRYVERRLSEDVRSEPAQPLSR